jgi:hypothetical protein
MGLGAWTRGSPAGAVDDQIDAKGFPVGQRLDRVEVGDLATADDEAAVFRRDVLGPAAVVGVHCEEGRQGLDILDIGDGRRDEQVVLERDPHQRPADATETMNRNPRHDVAPLSHCIGHGRLRGLGRGTGWCLSSTMRIASAVPPAR